MDEEQLIEEETYEESVRLRREREKCSKNWRPVEASTAVQLANLFSSGVNWAGSSKGDIVAGMQQTRPTTTSDWEGFREAMDYAAEKTAALKREVYQDIRANAQRIKERHDNTE